MPKRSVAFIKPPEPKFLKKMKEQMGYQEPDNIETKRQILPAATDDVDMSDDEKPTVVALKPGDLTQEEFDKELSSKGVNSKDLNKKIMFNKPEKRDSEETSPFVCSSKKIELKKRVKAQSDSTKKIKNASLLSFNDDEEEEDI